MELARRSVTAVRIAAALPRIGERDLERWLYTYGTVPPRPEWSLTSIADEVARAMAAGSVASRYRYERGTGWSSWWTGSHFPESLRFKLYVSPHPVAMTSAVPALVDRCIAAEVPAFKAGAGLRGTLRPDKLVAYFASRDALLAASVPILAAMSGYPVQGVPFTAAIDDAGMCSWGLDPPIGSARDGRMSWRSWITGRLAQAIVEAKASPQRGLPAWRAALASVALEGVDTSIWAPLGAGHGQVPDRAAPSK